MTPWWDGQHRVVPAPPAGLVLTCPVSGMSRAGLREGNGGDVGGSSRAAHGETRWVEAR